MNLVVTIKKGLNLVRNILLFKIRYRWVSYGRHVHCQASTRFWSPHKNIRLGDYVGIGDHCQFLADTEIGNDVLIADYVAFLNSDDHRYDVIGKTIWDSGRGDQHGIVVEDDVWIGHGAIILTPARIGRGAIVAAGAVVVKDVASYSIVAGVPARLIKMRFTPEQIARHERILREKGKMSDL